MEIEFSGNQEDDGLDGGEANEAAGASFSRLKQTIEGFEEAVGLAGLRPSDDALHVAAHGRGHLFHGLDLAAHHAGASVFKHAAHNVDLLAIKDLAQLLLVEPGASCTHGGHPGDQGVEVTAGTAPALAALVDARVLAMAGEMQAALVQRNEQFLIIDRAVVPDERRRLQQLAGSAEAHTDGFGHVRRQLYAGKELVDASDQLMAFVPNDFLEVLARQLAHRQRRERGQAHRVGVEAAEHFEFLVDAQNALDAQNAFGAQMPRPWAFGFDFAAPDHLGVDGQVSVARIVDEAAVKGGVHASDAAFGDEAALSVAPHDHSVLYQQPERALDGAQAERQPGHPFCLCGQAGAGGPGALGYRADYGVAHGHVFGHARASEAFQPAAQVFRLVREGLTHSPMILYSSIQCRSSQVNANGDSMSAPNFLIIMSDEHNPQGDGCNSYPVVSTPNLDALAARGSPTPQAGLLALNGGREAVIKRGEFGFTPAPGTIANFAQ